MSYKYLNHKEGPTRRRFLHVDLEELQSALTAAGNSGAAIKMWLAVRHKTRLTGKNVVKVTTDLCRQFGIRDRKAKARGITKWQQLGHWEVTITNGKNPVVQLLRAGNAGNPQEAPSIPAQAPAYTPLSPDLVTTTYPSEPSQANAVDPMDHIAQLRAAAWAAFDESGRAWHCSNEREREAFASSEHGRLFAEAVKEVAASAGMRVTPTGEITASDR
jgi:hypothetical protein